MKKFVPLLILSFVLICLVGNAIGDEFQLRNGINFGDTLDVIKQKETMDFESVTDDNTMAWFKGGKIGGIDGQVRFGFKDGTGKLTDMLYAFDKKEEKDYVDSEYSKLKNSLVRKYGDAIGNSGGSLHIITGDAFDYSATIIMLYQYIKGAGDFRDYDEWVVYCDDYNVKIDLVSYYYRTKDYDYSYQNLISYHYFTNNDYLDAIKEKQDENDAIDNDL